MCVCVVITMFIGTTVHSICVYTCLYLNEFLYVYVCGNHHVHEHKIDTPCRLGHFEESTRTIPIHESLYMVPTDIVLLNNYTWYSMYILCVSIGLVMSLFNNPVGLKWYAIIQHQHTPACTYDKSG